MATRRKAPSNGDEGSTELFARVMIVLLVLVLLGLVPIFSRITNVFHMVLTVTLDFGLVASLIANFVLYRKIRVLRAGPAPQAAPKAVVTKKAAAPAPSAPALKYDPKILPDPGLIFRFDLTKEPQRRIVIGQTDGTIKTYSTEVLDNHLEIDLRVRKDDDQDIYDQSRAIQQRYQVDLRRGGRVMVYYPGSERFREMDSRERLVIQEEPDSSGDFQFATLDPKNPIRFQLGDRIREDGKFVKGYMEFHLFTKPTESEQAGYTRVDQTFFVRVFKIFPGYDTAHPDEEGLYPMIDPFLSRT